MRVKFNVTSILVFNWRDVQNPNAGGAELYTQEIFSRLVKTFGFKVTLFTSMFEGAEPNVRIDGIEVIRRGGRYSVYGEAKAFYNQQKEEFDIVIDEINTRPFLTPKFVKASCPIVAIIHQLAREYWWYQTPFPINALGYYFLESYWLKNYVGIPTVTVSNSTFAELKDRGFSKLTIIQNGVSVTPLKSLPAKGKTFTAVFVGRLSKVKRPEDAIKAFLMANLGTDARLILVGDGELRAKLSRKYSRRTNVIFVGHVHQEAKEEIMEEAHIHIAPYIREGWGNTIMECAALGTPTIGYAVPGLVDSIIDKTTGFLVPKLDISALSERIGFARRSPDELERLAANGLDRARQFSWDKSAGAFRDLIENTLEGKGHLPRQN
jgi:glycosyltransferase involved in cell wall biosynthesis